MFRTKPSKEKKNFFKSEDDISDNEITNVSLKQFKPGLWHLTIESRSEHAGSCNTIVLTTDGVKQLSILLNPQGVEALHTAPDETPTYNSTKENKAYSACDSLSRELSKGECSAFAEYAGKKSEQT
jgi:hypothetical protein